MSTIELKEKIHQQIDLLTDEQDIEDLYANLSFFFQSREIHFDSNSPEFVKTLNASLQQNPKEAINSDELRKKVRKWLIK
jgi:Tfp pilus assembly pilus retraction ATPase PilT